MRTCEAARVTWSLIFMPPTCFFNCYVHAVVAQVFSKHNIRCWMRPGPWSWEAWDTQNYTAGGKTLLEQCQDNGLASSHSSLRWDLTNFGFTTRAHLLPRDQRGAWLWSNWCLCKQLWANSFFPYLLVTYLKVIFFVWVSWLPFITGHLATKEKRH